MIIYFVHSWNEFRSFCASDRKLRLALEIPTELPSDDEIDRWLGEPIGCAIIKCKSFLTNANGYPVLSAVHQNLVIKLLSRKVTIVITGATKEESRPFYQQYIHFLWKVRGFDFLCCSLITYYRGHTRSFLEELFI